MSRSLAAQIVERDRRLAALSALAVAAGYRMSVRSLRGQIELIGYVVSLDRLHTDLAWLDEQGLVERDTAADQATLTDRGLDVVMGRAEAPGVKRPEPGEV
jgi:hypothetical protein